MLKSVLAAMLFASLFAAPTAQAEDYFQGGPYYGNGPYYGGNSYGRNGMRSRTEQREYREEHTRREGRCKVGVYVGEVGACVVHAGPTADVPNDPECRGKPSGYHFDRAVTGPQGQRGVDHRVCR